VKYLAVFVLLVVVSSFPVSAQSNDVAVFAVGQYTHPVQGSQFGIPSERQSSKNSFGMGVEYRHWLKDNGLSVEFSRVASNATFPLWLMGETRYKFNAAYIRRFSTHSLVSPFLSGGGGTFLTYGDQGTWSGGVHNHTVGANTYWDNQPDVAIGGGVDIALNRAFTLRISNAVDFFRAPNFADPTYRGGRTFIQEPKIGMVYTWGSGRRNPL
jgi:hypothetical protein